MTAWTSPFHYTAEVRIYLDINGSQLEVRNLLDEFCIVRNPVDIAPCHAELVIIIDADVRRKPIYLKYGVSKDSDEVIFKALPRPDVKIVLNVNDKCHDVAEVIESEFILRDSICVCPCDAELIAIDLTKGDEKTWRIVLPDGITKDCKRVRYCRAARS